MSNETSFNYDNSQVFLREFTYNNSRFRDADGHELELCDGAIWLDELLILYQLKNRDSRHDHGDPSAESKWFRKKIERKAVDQLVDSRDFLKAQNTLPLTNLRGQKIDLALATPTSIHNVVAYSASVALPPSLSFLKGRVSKRIGFVHFFRTSDYAAILRVLCTPFEIAEYLTFRAEAFRATTAVNKVSEIALLGKYLSDTGFEVTSTDEFYVDRLIDNRDEFGIGRLLHHYLERVVWGNEGVEYHAILKELAKLRRNMLKVFRERLKWAMSKCRENMLVKPSRFLFPDTCCCFVFIPLPSSQRENWRATIEYFAILSKHDLRAEKCISITVAPDLSSVEHFLVNWLYLDAPWKPDAELDFILLKDDCFRKMREEWIGKYYFADT